MTAKDYPYNFDFPQRSDCKYDQSKATSCQVDSYTYAMIGDIDIIKMALTHQPVAATMNANYYNEAFKLYKSGIFDPDNNCDDRMMNHAVLLIGYGNEDG